MKTKGTILVVRGGAIGDFILTLPALAALRRNFPETRLELLAYPNVGPLALRAGLVDGFRPIEGRELAMFFARGGELNPNLADFFGLCSIVISYLYDPDEIFQTNMKRCSLGQFIQGPHRPNEAENLHAANVFLKPLERLAIFDADPRPRLEIGGAIASADSDRSWIALHPGSGSESKNWPEAKWDELLRRIVERRSEGILLIGGEAEGARLTRLAKSAPAERLEIARNLPLVDLAARMSRCRAFVGHDSGITHLAAALGLPGLALWARTNPIIWRPASAELRTIESGGVIAGLEVDRVFAELEKILARAGPSER